MNAVQEVASALAESIRKNGHWQQGHIKTASVQCSCGCKEYHAVYVGPGGRVCIVYAPDVWAYVPHEEWLRMTDELRSLICPGESLGHWNDSHTTDEVLATLDAIADGADYLPPEAS